MADDKNNGGAVEPQAPAAEPEKPETPSQPEGEAGNDLDNLKKTVGKLSETVNAQNEFIQGASVVINTLAYTPELRDAFQQQIKKQYGLVGEGEGTGQQPQPTPQANNTSNQPSSANGVFNQQLADVSTSQREQIINGFEKDMGMERLKEEDKKQVRREVESFLNDFGWSVANLPLSKLRPNMEKAYQAVRASKLREEGKQEGYVQATNNMYGALPSFGSGTTPAGDEKPQLTPDQAKWAKKLGIPVEEAAKTYAQRGNEADRKSLAEKKAEEARKG